MSNESPASILYSSDGYELAVQNGTSTPIGTRALLMAGSDGSTSRIILVDGSSRLVAVGAGTAGSAAGGVFSIQGVASGTAVTVGQSTAANLKAQVTGAGSAGSPDAGVITIQGVTNGTALNIVGTGTAGNPGTAVLTIQGIASGTAVPVSGTFMMTRSATSTLANVASSASSVTLLAANANRIQASVYNDSNSLLYIKLGTTASTSSFTVRLMPNAYFQVPDSYTGRIDGIWSNANGFARTDELTA